MITTNIEEQGMCALEREAFSRLVYGTTDSSSSEVWRVARRQLEAALELLPDAETAAYKEAMKKVPHLVEIESSPIRFLRFENYNAWSASKRLAAYWRHREAVFGGRAFLPMTQTGEGALSPEDLEVLNTGYIAILPNDRDQRPVLCYDRSRLDKDFDDREALTMQRLRCIFYIFSMVAENEVSQRDGFISLCVLNSSFSTEDFSFGMKAEQLVSEAMPLRRKRLHLVSSPPRSGKKKFTDIVFPQLVKFVGSLVKAVTMITHVGYSKEDTVKELERYDINKSGIPRSLGGTLIHTEYWTQWQRQRLRFEKTLHTDTGSDGFLKRIVAALNVTQEEEEKKRKREMNAHYGRRKRAKQRIESEVLQEQVSRHRRQQQTLLETNRRLEELLEKAKKLVEGHEARAAGELVELAYSPADKEKKLPAICTTQPLIRPLTASSTSSSSRRTDFPFHDTLGAARPCLGSNDSTCKTPISFQGTAARLPTLDTFIGDERWSPFGSVANGGSADSRSSPNLAPLSWASSTVPSHFNVARSLETQAQGPPSITANRQSLIEDLNREVQRSEVLRAALYGAVASQHPSLYQYDMQQQQEIDGHRQQEQLVAQLSELSQHYILGSWGSCQAPADSH